MASSAPTGRVGGAVRTAAAAAAAAAGEDPTFTILHEEIRHQRYLTFFDRKVQFPPTLEHPQVRQ